jgi:hypothetical protein
MYYEGETMTNLITILKNRITNISTREYKYYTSLAKIYEESVIDVFNDVSLESFPKWLVHKDPFMRK